MENEEYSQDAEVLQQVIQAFTKLDPESRQRILEATITFFGMDLRGIARPISSSRPSSSHSLSTFPSSFSEDRSMSPKDFLAEKQPSSDIERVVCLAYYLTHYKETPHFKSLDISKLNTEAAQVKLSNPHYTLDNAVKRGLLAPATKGYKQISAAGERYVLSLPDHAAAREALKSVLGKRRRIGRKKVKNS